MHSNQDLENPERKCKYIRKNSVDDGTANKNSLIFKRKINIFIIMHLFEFS